MNLRLAANMGLFTGWAKQQGQDFDPRTWLDEVRTCGFTGVELADAHSMFGTPTETRAALAEAGLEAAAYFASVTYNVWQPNVEAWQRDIAYAAELGVDTIMCCGGFMGSQRRTTHASDYDLFASSLEPAVRCANEHGMALAFHPHRGCIVETAAETAFMLERIPSLKLCWDCAHLEAIGDDAAAFVDRFTDSIVYTHIKDYHWGRDTFCELGQGDGALQVAAATNRLLAHGYTGWLCFELDKKWDQHQASATDSASAAVAYLTKHCSPTAV
ncbi:MAG: sugar phosphate isomerase/epimerase [Planctomycetota bacterium]|jgi:sugar phosphate isomerase/epimerase|nr:sugar phosphate isomerase/epimerase [Planctomycetota bacterium]